MTNNTTADTTASGAGEGVDVALEMRRLNYQAERLEHVYGMLGAAENVREAATKLQAAIDTLRAQLEAAEAEIAYRTSRLIVHKGQALACSELVQRAHDDMRDRAEAAEADAARMSHAGAMLANCAFNLAQRKHLTDEERRSLDLSRIAWDAARAKAVTP